MSIVVQFYKEILNELCVNIERTVRKLALDETLS